MLFVRRLLVLLFLFAPLGAWAQFGYVVTRTGDSLAGPIIYQYQLGALHLVSDGQVYTISTGQVSRFAIYDMECGRFRHYEPIEDLDSLAPDGLHHAYNKPVICEVANLAGGGKLLMRAPYRYKDKQMPSLQDALMEASNPETKTDRVHAAERQLRQMARRTTRKYADTDPVYYFQKEGQIVCLSPVRKFIHLKWRKQDTRALLSAMGERGRAVREWVRQKGSPLMRRKRMDAFVLAFCHVEAPDYARP